jgi:Rha family phage regulatory protein
LRDIGKITDPKSGASEKFSRTNFGLSNYEIRGKKYPEYFMTKDGFTILVMGYTGEKAMSFKEQYIDAFNTLLKIVQERQTIEWKETRQQGKLTRRDETDILKELVEYAKTQGSENSNKLYMIYSKLANKAAGIEERDSATTIQLNNLNLMENIILNVVRQGMKLEKHYKDIYQECKRKLEQFNELTYLSA